MIEYIVILSKEQSKKLAELSEAAGENNELAFLDNKIAEWLSSDDSAKWKEIKKLKEQIDREGKLILKMKDDISFYKRKVNNLNQKLKSKAIE